MRVAIVGRPNAGKSSLLNRLLGEERALVSEVAGTTRDTGRPDQLQRASLCPRRHGRYPEKSRIDEQPKRRVLRAIRVMDDADVVVVVLDALGGVTDQDARIINLAVDRYKPVLPSSTSGTSYPRIGKHKQYTENIHRILAT